MYLLINGSRPNFDRQATEVHELGHTLGLAHSSVGFADRQGRRAVAELESRGADDAPVLDQRRPTAARSRPTTRAALSELYPATAAFATTPGTITGTVTRCGTGEPVLGANVRAINVANPTIQLTRMTGFDGRTDGSYTIHGVPPGEYDVVVEPLGRRRRVPRPPLDVHARRRRLHAGVLQRDQESDCAQDTDPNEQDERPGRRERRRRPPTSRSRAPTLALVIDVTGSMGPEIGGDQDRARHDDQRRSRRPAAASRRRRSSRSTTSSAIKDGQPRPGAAARTSSTALTTHSTADCPEGSNRALMTAGRQLGRGGRAILVTDADSHPDRPAAASVDELYASKGRG